MREIASVTRMQALARRWRGRGTSVALVPTMGYLHAGHLSLIRRARRAIGRHGKVVVSLYVNPTQFAPHEDLARYPRDLPRDRRLCRAAGADVLFVPTDAGMYPCVDGGSFSTYVAEETLSRLMEGSSRPSHFRGVTTVVAKLFNIVLPDVVVFGAKDYQQAAIVGRMVRDLNFPLRMIVAPTVRERDSLALSSRNKYLSASQRPQATVLWRSLQEARRRVREARGGVRVSVLRRRVQSLVAAEPEARLEYVEFFDPKSFLPVMTARRGNRVALAVFVGATRLIDNACL